MPVFMNPFHKHDVSEFPDTFVPLAHAERHPSIVAAHKDMGGKNLPPASPNSEAGDTSDNEYSAYTIEGLIREIDLGMLSTTGYCEFLMIFKIDIVASGHNTAYDRTYFAFIITFTNIHILLSKGPNIVVESMI